MIASHHMPKLYFIFKENRIHSPCINIKVLHSSFSTTEATVLFATKMHYKHLSTEYFATYNEATINLSKIV